MERLTFEAMGTEVTGLLPIAHAGEMAAVRRVFDDWERVLSRFRPESELSRLNAAAGHERKVSPLLASVVAASLDAARATGGTFDPTLQRHMAALGYDRTFEELHPVTAPLPGPGGGWRRILFDPERRTVRLPPGVGFDFGGIAKGMAVDAALGALAEHGVPSALIDAGGDLAVLGHLEGGAWPVAVELPSGTSTVFLEQGALGTSGVGRRQWIQDGTVRHHLLDPGSGLPSSSGLFQVTVAAPTCREAEVAAKTVLIRGGTQGASWLSGVGLAGVLIDDHEQVTRVGPWPDEEGGRAS